MFCRVDEAVTGIVIFQASNNGFLTVGPMNPKLIPRI